MIAVLFEGVAINCSIVVKRFVMDTVLVNTLSALVAVSVSHVDMNRTNYKVMTVDIINSSHREIEHQACRFLTELLYNYELLCNNKLAHQDRVGIWWVASGKFPLPAKPQDKSVTQQGGTSVSEILLDDVSDMEAPADTIVRQTEQETAGICIINGLDNAMNDLSSVVHQYVNSLCDDNSYHDYLELSVKKKIDRSVADLVIPSRKLVEIRLGILDNRQDK